MRALLGLFIGSHDWRYFQCLLVLRVGITSFFALAMISVGVSERSILLYLSIYLFISFIYVYFVKRIYASQFKLVNLLSLFVVSFCLVCFCIFLSSNQLVASLFFIFGVSIIIGLSDIRISDFNWSVQKGAESIGEAPLVALSLSSFVTSIIIAVSYLLFGFLASLGVDILVFVIASFVMMLAVLYKDGNTHFSNPTASSTTGPALPAFLFYKVVLSILFTTTTYFGRLFVFPLLLLQASRDYGVDADVFKYFGFFLCFVTLSALFSRRLVAMLDVIPKKMMMLGYFTGLVCWLLIFLVYQNESNLYGLLVGLFLYLVLDITSKFWNSGYIASVSELAGCYADDSYSAGTLNNVYMVFHIQCSKVFAALFFFIFFIFYDKIKPELLLSYGSVVAILYGLLYVYCLSNKKRA